MLIGLGILFLIAAGLALLTGVIMLTIGAIESNKRKMKTAAYVLAGAALGLLVSFSLCTSMGTTLGL